MRACVSSLVMAILVVVAPVRAEVVEQSDGHFAVSNTVTVSVESGRAFRAITAEVGQWWDPVHTFFGSAEALLFDWGGGLIWALLPAGTDLRARLGEFPGHATLIRGDRTRRAMFQPEPAPLAALSRGLRQRFDPKGLFNPGLMG